MLGVNWFAEQAQEEGIDLQDGATPSTDGWTTAAMLVMPRLVLIYDNVSGEESFSRQFLDVPGNGQP